MPSQNPQLQILERVNDLSRRLRTLESQELPSLATGFTGILPPARGGTGIDNGGQTLTIAANSGTIAFGAAGKTLTVNHSLTLAGADGRTLTIPATGTAALLGTANVFTAAQTINGNLVVDTNVLFVDAVNNRVGVGTAVPQGVTSAVFRVNGNVVIGANTTPTLISGQANGGAIEILSDPNTGNRYIAIGRINNSGVFTSCIMVPNSENVLIGTTTDQGQLTVDQPSTTAAEPVLVLDQGDVDQDFIEFVGGSSTGNATSISTDAAGAYAGRIQITVNGTRRWLNFYADA